MTSAQHNPSYAQEGKCVHAAQVIGKGAGSLTKGLASEHETAARREESGETAMQAGRSGVVVDRYLMGR